MNLQNFLSKKISSTAINGSESETTPDFRIIVTEISDSGIEFAIHTMGDKSDMVRYKCLGNTIENT